MTGELDDIQYLVLPDATKPHLLARVRWPDVCQAISPVRPYWQDDPGLFDLPYHPTSTPVTFDEAAAIAAEWDARLPADAAAATPGLSFMRRMPADWSNLSRAEQRAWSIESMTVRERATTRRRLGRRRVRTISPARAGLDLARAELAVDDVVIDLTHTTQDAQVTADGA